MVGELFVNLVEQFRKALEILVLDQKADAPDPCIVDRSQNLAFQNLRGDFLEIIGVIIDVLIFAHDFELVELGEGRVIIVLPVFDFILIESLKIIIQGEGNRRMSEVVSLEIDLRIMTGQFRNQPEEDFAASVVVPVEDAVGLMIRSA